MESPTSMLDNSKLKQTIELDTKNAIIADVDNGVSYEEIKRRYNLKSSANICVILKKRQYYLNRIRIKSKKSNNNNHIMPPPQKTVKKNLSSSSSGVNDHKQAIDLFTKQKIIDDVDNGVSHKEIVTRYNLKSLSNISVILKNRDYYLSEINNPLSCGLSKLVKRSKYRNIEDMLHQFLREDNNNNNNKQRRSFGEMAHLSEEFLKEKATELALSLGMEDFSFSEAYIKNLKVYSKFFFFKNNF
jgi:Mor family transcriptional regulator